MGYGRSWGQGMNMTKICTNLIHETPMLPYQLVPLLRSCLDSHFVETKYLFYKKDNVFPKWVNLKRKSKF